MRVRELDEGMLSTASVDSQLIAFLTTSIRLNELDPEDKLLPNCAFNNGERKKCGVEGMSKIHNMRPQKVVRMCKFQQRPLW